MSEASFVSLKKMDKKILPPINRCFPEKKTAEAKDLLDKHYPNFAQGKSTVETRRGLLNLNGVE